MLELKVAYNLLFCQVAFWKCASVAPPSPFITTAPEFIVVTASPNIFLRFVRDVITSEFPPEGFPVIENGLNCTSAIILLFNCTRNTSWRFYPPRSKNYEYDIYSPSKALHVFFPTIPSALSPCALWNAITAARVPVPKIPSTLPQLNPRLFNLS